MTGEQYNESGNNKLNSNSHDKIDLALQQLQAVQRSIALLKADLTETIEQAFSAALNKRAIQDYSR